MRKYRDFYGYTATLEQKNEYPFRWVLKVFRPQGYSVFICIFRREYNTFHGARIAMGHMSEGWQEVKT